MHALKISSEKEIYIFPLRKIYSYMNVIGKFQLICSQVVHVRILIAK